MCTIAGVLAVNIYHETLLSLSKHPHVAKYGLRPSLRVTSYQKADQTGGEGGINIGGDDELAVDVEAEAGAAGYDEESVGMSVAACDCAGGGPVDEGEPVEGVIADGAHEAILAPAADFKDVELAIGGAETEDEAVDVAIEQARLGGDDDIAVLLLAGVAPGDLARDGGADVIALRREIALRAIIDPATAGVGHVIGVEYMTRAYGCGDAGSGLGARLGCQRCLLGGLRLCSSC